MVGIGSTADKCEGKRVAGKVFDVGFRSNGGLGARGISAAAKSPIRETAKSMLGYELITRCGRAPSLLQELLQIESRLIFDLENEKDVVAAQQGTIPQLADARMALWLSFGEVLGVLKDEDTTTRRSDARSLVPRAFKLQPIDSPDSIHDRLVDLEADYLRREFTPEEIVDRLGNTIEQLTQRLWPQDFMPVTDSRGKRSRPKVGTVLHGRFASGNELDRRFAAIAISLRTYRNSAEHNRANLKCSYEEARFFLAGVRALVDLWKQISDERGR